MRFEAAAISEAGPRNVNEDEVAWWTNSDASLVAAIADGLGGMGGGEKAAQIAVSSMRKIVNPQTFEAIELGPKPNKRLDESTNH